MPCQSDYLAASGQELESKRVCKLLIYVYGEIKKDIPGWIGKAADDYYGNTRRLDEATAKLCEACRLLSKVEAERIIYNAHDKQSRDLARWFEKHKEWDKRRVAEEKETRKKIILKDRALQKLTIDEIKALGLE